MLKLILNYCANVLFGSCGARWQPLGGTHHEVFISLYPLSAREMERKEAEEKIREAEEKKKQERRVRDEFRQMLQSSYAPASFDTEASEPPRGWCVCLCVLFACE